MTVKFGPEGYSSASIRRFRDHRPPEVDLAVKAGSTSAGRSRVLGIALAIAVMVCAVMYLGRPQPAPIQQSATARIVAKDTVPLPGGGARHVLGLAIRLGDGGESSVIVECSEEQWRQVKAGDEIVAHYAAAPDGGLVVTGIVPKPAPVEL